MESRRRIKWIDRVRNDEVLNRVKGNRTILDRIPNRKGDRVGHVVSGKGILTTVLDGTLEGEEKRKDSS